MIQITIQAQDVATAAKILGAIEAAKTETTTTTQVTTGKAGRKAKQETLDIGFDETEDSDDSDDTGTEFEMADVVKAFKAYAQENSKDDAIKILKKLGVKSVRDLKTSQFAKAMSLVEAA